MRLIQFAHLARAIPRPARRALIGPWNRLLAWEQGWHERALYAPFVSEDDLVFDVGANHGLKTAAFLSLGAKVVAVEPNPICQKSLNEKFALALAKGHLTIIPHAIAASPGIAILQQFLPDGCNASISVEFAESQAATFGPPSATFEVSVITARALLEQFGTPAFIKIDIEGMDDQVLETMRERPRAMSFEYNLNPDVLGCAQRCIAHSERLGFTIANFTNGSDTQFKLENWVPIAEVLAQAKRLARGREWWGDVFVK